MFHRLTFNNLQQAKTNGEVDGRTEEDNRAV